MRKYISRPSATVLAFLLMLNGAIWVGATVNRLSAAEESQPRQTEINSDTISVLIPPLLSAHFSETKLTPKIAERIMRQALSQLDGSKIFLTKEEADELIGSGDERFAALVKRFLAGDTSDIAKLRAAVVEASRRDKAFFDGLDDKAEEIKTLAKTTKKLSRREDWAATDDARIARILEFAAVIYNANIAYLNEADAMKMTLSMTKQLYDKIHEEQKPEAAQYLFLKSLMTALDPHSSYTEPGNNRYDDLQIRAFAGIGLQLRQAPAGAVVDSVIPGSPAHKSGKFKKGDMLVAVNDTPVSGKTIDEIVKLIKGERGTEVKLTVLKSSGGEPEVIALIRDIIDVTQLKVKGKVEVVGGKRVAVISVNSFYQGMSADVAAKISDLKAEGAIDGMVLDLRDNGGGLLGEALGLVGIFIPNGPVTGVKGNDGRVEYIGLRPHAVSYSGPLVVLVNQGSASASEVFAGAIQDYGRGLVVGPTQTFGKGSVQSLSPLWSVIVPGNFALTTQLYFLPRGGSVQNKGVIPDIVILGLKLDPEALESAMPNVIPWEEVEGELKDQVAEANRWTDWKKKNLEALSKRSKDRMSEEYQKALRGDAEEGDVEALSALQAQEAIAIVSDMIGKWGE
jgi:carboxyl-terminal processing protease